MIYLEQTAERIRRHVPDALVPPDAAPLFLLYAVLLRAKGDAVTPSDVHDAWVAWIVRTDPGHPQARPYDQLDEATRAQDEPFVAAIRTAARRDARHSQAADRHRRRRSPVARTAPNWARCGHGSQPSEVIDGS